MRYEPEGLASDAPAIIALATAERRLAGVLERPQQLGAEQATEDASHADVGSSLRQPRAAQLAPEQPHPHQRADRHEHTKTGDFEVADAKQDWINGGAS